MAKRAFVPPMSPIMRKSDTAFSSRLGLAGITNRMSVGHNETMDRLGEAVVFIAVRRDDRSAFDSIRGIAHGDAESALLKHTDVVRHVADGDPLGRNVQQFGERKNG